MKHVSRIVGFRVVLEMPWRGEGSIGPSYAVKAELGRRGSARVQRELTEPHQSGDGHRAGRRESRGPG